MQINSGMIPRRYLAEFRSRARETGTRFSMPSWEFLAGATVFAAVFFNFGLALLNTNIVPLSRGSVILAEVIIMVAAVAICARSFNRLMIPWLVVASLLAILFIILSMFRQSIEPKYFRDVLLIPVFVALGLTFAKGNIVKLFVTIQAVILAVMIFEGLSLDMFGNAVNPMSYYVNTRGTSIEAFWMRDSLLYISAFRPSGRLYSFLNIHRLSSTFLEPVSLGNWCIIITIFLAAFWRDLSRKAAVFLILSNIFLIIGSDGRLATVTSIAILAIAFIAPRLPRYSYFLYLPGAVILAVILVWVLDPPAGDNYLGRLDFSVSVLSRMDMSAILGLNSLMTVRSADSGISYIILTQSLLGTVLLWGAICFLQPPTDRTAIKFLHGTALYIALVLLISYSLFSIKTAAPLWFLYGYVRARNASIS